MLVKFDQKLQQKYKAKIKGKEDNKERYSTLFSEDNIRITYPYQVTLQLLKGEPSIGQHEILSGANPTNQNHQGKGPRRLACH